MMNVKPYEDYFKVYSFLIDTNLELTFSNLMCFLQEVAWAHSNSENVGWKFLQSKNMFWALARFYLKIDRMPKWEEKILIKTWARPVEHIIHPRDFEVFDANGNRILAATSSWIVLDKTEFKPQSIEFELEKNVIIEQNALNVKIPKIPRIEFTENSVYKSVLYSDIDMNRHVNNTRYLLWTIDDYDPDFLKNHRIASCNIHYIAQANLGTNYAIQRNEIEPNNFISSIIDEQRHELCRVQIEWRKRD